MQRHRRSCRRDCETRAVTAYACAPAVESGSECARHQVHSPSQVLFEQSPAPRCVRFFVLKLLIRHGADAAGFVSWRAEATNIIPPVRRYFLQPTLLFARFRGERQKDARAESLGYAIGYGSRRFRVEITALATRNLSRFCLVERLEGILTDTARNGSPPTRGAEARFLSRERAFFLPDYGGPRAPEVISTAASVAALMASSRCLCVRRWTRSRRRLPRRAHARVCSAHLEFPRVRRR